jgi:hypothetical protein
VRRLVRARWRRPRRRRPHDAFCRLSLPRQLSRSLPCYLLV